MLQLFTDTSANLPVALTKKHHITVIPFSYTVDGKATDYPDDTDFDGAAFYGAMREGAIVKTSMVSPSSLQWLVLIAWLWAISAPAFILPLQSHSYCPTMKSCSKNSTVALKAALLLFLI